jgi:chaperone required for assembly of F1-ATPase
VRTPARRVLEAPTCALADALAAEWNAQQDVVDPHYMPLTRLANSILDGVVDAPAAVRAEIEKYLASDLLVYRAEGPPGLVARQAQAWDPLIDWRRVHARAARVALCRDEGRRAGARLAGGGAMRTYEGQGSVKP